MIRKIPFIVGETYHSYSRGTDKRIIFTNDNDYRRFVFSLYICNNTISVRTDNLFQQGRTLLELFGVDRKDTLVYIIAFCLMPNHFHLLLHEKIDGGISLFMQKLLTAYSMYFNTKHDREGSLFESRFKAKHINTDAYLNWIFSYIHLNPFKLIHQNWKEKGISNLTSAKKFIQNYRYSSYYDYFIGDRPEKVILNKDIFFDQSPQINSFEDILKEFEKDFDEYNKQ